MIPESNIYGVISAFILLLNTLIGVWIARRVVDVHHEMNSMKDQLVESVKDAATQRGHAAGVLEGKSQIDAETAALKVIAEPVKKE